MYQDFGETKTFTDNAAALDDSKYNAVLTAVEGLYSNLVSAQLTAQSVQSLSNSTSYRVSDLQTEVATLKGTVAVLENKLHRLFNLVVLEEMDNFYDE